MAFSSCVEDGSLSGVDTIEKIYREVLTIRKKLEVMERMIVPEEAVSEE